MSGSVAGGAGLVSGTVALSRRSILGMVRQPQVVGPALFFPLFFAALNNAAIGRATDLPDFPEVPSYLAFLLAGTTIQGIMFSSTSVGVDMALDIESGFLDRLLASPANRISILLGRLAGAASLGAVLVGAFTGAFAPFGAVDQLTLPALVVFILCGSLLAVAFGGLATAAALRTGSVEAVNGIFPIYFALVFLSSAFFPMALVDGWFGAIAGANPITFLVDGLREITIVGWDAGAALQSLAVATLLAAASVALAVRSLRTRVGAR